VRIRRAYTLVEILIALTLLSVLLVLAYEIMSKMFTSGIVAQWDAERTTQFANSDSRIRDFLNASSYPSLLTPQGNAVLRYDPPNNFLATAFLLGVPDSIAASGAGEPPGYRISFTNSDKGDKNPKSVADNETLVTWFRCQEGRQGIEGLSTQLSQATTILLKARNLHVSNRTNINLFDLYMVEQQLTPFPETDITAFQAVNTAPAAAAGGTRATLMVQDCRCVTIRLLSRTAAVPPLPYADRVQLQVEITCVEPTQGQATKSRTISAEGNVGANKVLASG
jgi:prepilin-type N-terminal cleavage/methylation domain-containing protein